MKEKKGTGLSRDKNLRVNKTAGYKFVKKDKSVNRRAGLHDKKKNIAEGERRVVRCKPLALKHKRRMRKVAVVLAAVCVGAVSYVGMGFLFKPDGLSVEDLGNYTVKAQKIGDNSKPAGGGKVYYFPEDGSLPTDHTLIENVAYLNYVLSDVQTSWSSSMKSTVYTVMNQTVYNHKKSYKDEAAGIYSFVSADKAVGASGMEEQFCVTEEEVLWRNAAIPSSENGLEKYGYNMDIVDWDESKIYGNTIAEFRSYRGLPANDFSVYILDENTVKNANDTTVKDNGDGTYTMTLDLKVHQEGLDSAVHYYKQQMYINGGLYAWPTFDYTRVTYNFTADWRLLSFTINDGYSAKMGVIAAACTSESTTVFNYEQENAQNTYRPDDFAAYEGGNYIRYSPYGATRTLDAATCLANAFGSVLEEGATFKLNMNLNGRDLSGAVYVGLNDGSISDLRVALGGLKVFLGEDNGKQTLFLAAGKDKFRLCTEGLFGSEGGETQEGESSSDGDNALAGILDVNGLMKQLFAGEFDLQEKSASLKSTISLFGLDIPIEFAFNVKGLDASLDYVSTSFSLNGSPVKARLEFGTEEDIPAAPDGNERAQYKDILNGGLTLNLKLGLDKLVLNGAAEIKLENGKFTGVNAYLGNYAAHYNADNGLVYLNLDGYKYKLDSKKLSGGNGSVAAAVNEDNGASALQQLISFIVGGISTDGNGLNFNGALAADNSFNVLGAVIKLGVDVNLRGYLGVNANIELGGKTAFAEVSVAENNSAIPQIGNVNDYKDILNGGISLSVNSLKIDGLDLSGSVYLGLKDGKINAVRANLSNKEGDVAVHFDSAEDTLYIKAGDGIKVKLSLSALGLGGNNGGAQTLGEGQNGFDTGVLFGGIDFKDVLKQVIGNLTCGESSLTTSAVLDIKNLGKANIGATVNLADGIGAEVKIDILNKNISLGASLAKDVEVPGLTAEQKAEYADVLNEGFNVNGNLQVTVGETALNLAINKLAVSLQMQQDGTAKFGFALDSRLTVKDMYFDLYISYLNGVATVVYGDAENYFGAKLDIEGGDLSKLEEALVSVYNRICAVLDEIITNNPLKPTDIEGLESRLTVENLTGILSKLGVAISLEKGGENVLKMLGIPQNNGKLDIKGLINGLRVYSPENSILGVTLGNMALQLKNSGVSASVDLEMANSAVRVYLENLSLGLYSEPACPVKDSGLLTAGDFAEMLDYLAASAELLIEDEYSLSANATVFNGKDIAFNVGILFEYVKGEKFPVQITLPATDKDGNKTGLKVDIASDMYWHLGVVYDGNGTREVASGENKVKVDEDDLYLDFWILDANPAGESSDGVVNTQVDYNKSEHDGLDVYVSVSKYKDQADADAKKAKYVAAGLKADEPSFTYAPLKIYAPVDEILTVLSAGVALLNLQGIDVSAQSAKINGVIKSLAGALDSALVQKYLPYTHSQFASLGQSLIPQFLGTDLNGLIQKLLASLSAKPENDKEQTDGETVEKREGETVEEEGGDNPLVPLPAEPAPAHFINKVGLGTSADGDRALQIVLNGAAVYGEGFENLTFEAYKNYSYGAAFADGEEGGVPVPEKSYITGAAVKNIYFGGSKKIDLGLNVKRNVEKAQSFENFYDFSGASSLLKALVNSITHGKASATDREKEIFGTENLPDYILNHYYYINGSLNVGLNIIGMVDANINLKIVAASVTIDEKTNDVGINVRISYDAVSASALGATYKVIDGACDVDLTIKGGMLYIKRTQTTQLGKSDGWSSTLGALISLGGYKVEGTNGKEETLATPIVTHRVYPLSAISTDVSDIMDLVSYVLNLNQKITDIIDSEIAKSMSESKETVSYAEYDIGNQMSSYLKYFKYSENGENSAKWDIALNGKFLTDFMGMKCSDPVISFNTAFTCDANGNKEYIIKNLSLSGFEITLVEIGNNGIKLSASGSFDYCNPQLVMQSDKNGETIVDITQNLSPALERIFGCDSKKIAKTELWQQVVNEKGYLEITSSSAIRLGKVNYVLYGVDGGVLKEGVCEDYALYDSEKILTVCEIPRLPEVNGYEIKCGFNAETLTYSETYAAKNYSVNIESAHAISGAGETLNYTYGTDADLSGLIGQTTQVGDLIYKLVAFELDGVEYPSVIPASAFEAVYGKELTLKAVWKDVYAVTLGFEGITAEAEAEALNYANANAGFADGKLYYEKGGEAIALNALANLKGFDFIGYALNGETVTEIYGLNGNAALTAVFKDVRINLNLTSDVAFTYNGQTAVEKDGGFVLNVHIIREESAILNAENADGWQFLGWWYATEGENGETVYNRLTDALAIAAPGETVETEIRALWGKANISGQSTKDGGFFKGYDYTMVSTASCEFKGYDGLIGKINRTATEYDWYLDNGLTPVMTKEVNNVNGNNLLSCTFDKLHIGSTSGIMNNWKVSCRLTFGLPDGTECVLSATSSGKF